MGVEAGSGQSAGRSDGRPPAHLTHRPHVPDVRHDVPVEGEAGGARSQPRTSYTGGKSLPKHGFTRIPACTIH